MNHLPPLLHPPSPSLFSLSFFLLPPRIHVEWMRAFTGAILELQEYVKIYHVTGLTWNPDVSLFPPLLFPPLPFLLLPSLPSFSLPSSFPNPPPPFSSLFLLLPPPAFLPPPPFSSSSLYFPPSSVSVWFPKVWSILQFIYIAL